MSSEVSFVSLSKISPELAQLQKHFPSHLPSDHVFVRGNTELLYKKRGLSLGIIGTRMPSEYGYRIVQELISRLAGHNISIVSGGAFGIDAESHRMALKYGLATRAWLVGPINDPSPKTQRALFDQIASTPGSALMVPQFLEASDGVRYKLGAKAWLARNAWIAADSDLVLCVEASLKSGTWQTARDSRDLGKDFYAIPGSIFERRSEGCNSMISKSYATGVTNLKEFAESLVVRALRSSYNKGRPYQEMT